MLRDKKRNRMKFDRKIRNSRFQINCRWVVNTSVFLIIIFFIRNFILNYKINQNTRKKSPHDNGRNEGPMIFLRKENIKNQIERYENIGDLIDLNDGDKMILKSDETLEFVHDKISNSVFAPQHVGMHLSIPIISETEDIVNTNSETKNENMGDSKTRNILLADFVTYYQKREKDLFIRKYFEQEIAMKSLSYYSKKSLTKNLTHSYFDGNDREFVKIQNGEDESKIQSVIDDGIIYKYNTGMKSTEAKPNLLCATFTSIDGKSINEILDKVFAFNTHEKIENKIENENKKENENINENERIKNNGDNKNIKIKKNKKYCDWYIIIYGGEKKYLSILKEKINNIENKFNLTKYDEKKIYGGVNSHNRYKGKVVQIAFPSRTSIKRMMRVKKEKYLNQVLNILQTDSGNENKNATEKNDFIQKTVNKITKNKNSSNSVYNSLTLPKPLLLLPLFTDIENEYSISDYDDVWLVDGDLHVRGFNLNSYFHIRNNIKLSKPSLSKSTQIFKSIINNFQASQTGTQNNENSSISVFRDTNYYPLVSQPLLYENTQSYEFLNFESWKKKRTFSDFIFGVNKNDEIENNENENEMKSVSNIDSKKLTEIKSDNGKKRKKAIALAETRFVEIQNPIIGIRFFRWFFDFFIIPLLDPLEILGTDWGLDSLFCTAAKYFRKEEIKYRKSFLTLQNENNKNNNFDNSQSLKSSEKDKDFMSLKNDLNVCVVIVASPPIHHTNDKVISSKLGYLNKKLLGLEMMKIVRKKFPLFYLDGRNQICNPLIKSSALYNGYI